MRTIHTWPDFLRRRTLGTGLIEVDGITHVALCGKDPINGEWWNLVACDAFILGKTVTPGHVDRLAFPTCLWCSVEEHHGPY